MNLIGKEVVMNDGNVGTIVSEKDGYFNIDVFDSDTLEDLSFWAKAEDFNYAEVVMQETMKMIDEVIENLEDVERNISDYHDASRLSYSIDKVEELRDYLKSLDD